MVETIFVKPRHGLILDGIPASGADIPSELAEVWLADRLVERIEQPVAIKSRPAVRRSPRGSGATRPKKQRRTR